jgi:NAD(P)H-dependent FMN reductase
VLDLAELALPAYDGSETAEQHRSAAAFRQEIDAADAVIWLTPEYNHAYTAAIKNAIDFLGTETRRKPALVCGLSGGAFGGARAVEQLKLVLIELHAVPIRQSVYFSEAGSLFEPEHAHRRTDFVRRIDDAIADLSWYAEALGWGRRHLASPAGD